MRHSCGSLGYLLSELTPTKAIARKAATIRFGLSRAGQYCPCGALGEVQAVEHSLQAAAPPCHGPQVLRTTLEGRLGTTDDE